MSEIGYIGRQHAIAAHIARQFIPISNEIEKAEQEANTALEAEEFLEKGGKRAVIGEKRMFGGREYIKTAQGWKFHGKGGGKKAQEHANSSSGGQPQAKHIRRFSELCDHLGIDQKKADKIQEILESPISDDKAEAKISSLVGAQSAKLIMDFAMAGSGIKVKISEKKDNNSTSSKLDSKEADALVRSWMLGSRYADKKYMKQLNEKVKNLSFDQVDSELKEAFNRLKSTNSSNWNGLQTIPYEKHKENFKKFFDQKKSKKSSKASDTEKKNEDNSNKKPIAFTLNGKPIYEPGTYKEDGVTTIVYPNDKSRKKGTIKESEDEKGVREYFQDYLEDLPTSFSPKKAIDFIAKQYSLTKDQASMVLVNMEDTDVMMNIANGNFNTFDLFDRSQFNDSHDDMLDQLGFNSDEDDD